MFIRFIVICAIVTGFSALSLKPLPRDCADPSILKDGEYTIYPDGVIPVKVFCNVQGGGWTQIMNKVDRTVGPFKKTRIEYINGFGEPSSNFWLGLDSIRALVASEPTMLRIELANGDYWMEYESFYIDSEAEGYSLKIGQNKRGNLKDTFSLMDGNKFYAIDDNHGCPSLNNAGWWFKDCYSVCLTCEKTFNLAYEGHWNIKENNWMLLSNAKMFIKSQIAQKPSNCYEIYKSGRTENGIYRIYPDTSSDSSIQVYCEMGLGGWTRIMARNTNLNYSFLRDYETYKSGFGDILTNHWLGLRNMRSILRKEQYQLRIELSNNAASDKFIVYDSFLIDSESDNFKLILGPKVLGELYDALTFSNGMAFSAIDTDHDISVEADCANFFRGAWWFRDCYRACLTCSREGVWSTATSPASLYFTNIKMLIRPKSVESCEKSA